MSWRSHKASSQHKGQKVEGALLFPQMSFTSLLPSSGASSTSPSTPPWPCLGGRIPGKGAKAGLSSGRSDEEAFDAALYRLRSIAEGVFGGIKTR